MKEHKIFWLVLLGVAITTVAAGLVSDSIKTNCITTLVDKHPEWKIEDIKEACQ